jgi:UDP-N-acetylglucosamine--N-acetylmuramyl-(pentapeptide) pyrophosphoryl-undecaprenol N-acetylglucosamine transferase
VVTGCPIRPSLLEVGRAEAVAALGLDRRRRTLLVTGASSGARTVNRAVVGMLRQAGLGAGWQVLHLTGSLDYETVAAAYADLSVPAVVRAYVHRMGLAYAAADLAVARAGASTVAELLAAAVPAVFMPYPFHRDRHQMRHGRVAEMKGAAVVVQDRPDGEEATRQDLAEAVRPLLKDEVRRAEMRENARRAAQPGAAEAVARLVLELADAAARRRQDALRRDVDNRPPLLYTPTREAIR